MIRVSTSTRKGFTLVEIMIVVAIIALLASIAVPNFLRSRKRSQATQILQDLRQIDSAHDQYYTENPDPNVRMEWSDTLKYLKDGTRLYTSEFKDVLGNEFGYDLKARSVHLAKDSFKALSDVAPEDFWGQFKPSPNSQK